MATYRELLAQARAEIDEISTPEAHALVETDEPPLFVDVRPREEWDEGHLPGAIHLPRNNLESRVEALVTDRTRPLVVYCESGSRSAFATKTLVELGYEHAVNLAGGFADWKRNGYEFVTPVALAPAQRTRYARHLMIPEVGEEGQQRLLDSRVLLIGAGGLGSPASLYLAAAGVGTLGIIDAGRRRRLEPPAPDRPLDRTARRAQGRVRAADDRGAQPRRDRRAVRGAARLGERRADPRPRLGRDRRRHRQLPDALPRQRRLRLARHPRRARLDLPLRGAGHRFPPRQRTVLSLPLPFAPAARARSELRGGRCARRPARDHRLAPGERGAEARARRRRDARRPPAALRRARNDLRRGRDPPQPGVPRLRRQPDDHRVHRLRRVLPGPLGPGWLSRRAEPGSAQPDAADVDAFRGRAEHCPLRPRRISVAPETEGERVRA